jgi:sulfatase modifying factor 1
MGANDPPDMNPVGMNATRDARPIHRVYVDGFFMEKAGLTNEFARFVKTPDYVTVAERKLRAGDFPGPPQQNLVAGSVVFLLLITPYNSTIIFSGGVTRQARTGVIRSARDPA